MARLVTKSEQERKELEEFDYRTSRNNGYKMRKIKDQNWAKIRNYKGGEALFFWHVDSEMLEGETRRLVAPGMFILAINGVEGIFDAEEFRRWLRWA